eukprot:GHVP01053496.1.p1 GENE.GHVP01053496.1~~GHVP01053496.1.p1  ORF type:complete len:514 (-),score=82.45 GHVP01053496.1:147-1688(-)
MNTTMLAILLIKINCKPISIEDNDFSRLHDINDKSLEVELKDMIRKKLYALLDKETKKAVNPEGKAGSNHAFHDKIKFTLTREDTPRKTTIEEKTCNIQLQDAKDRKSSYHEVKRKDNNSHLCDIEPPTPKNPQERQCDQPIQRTYNQCMEQINNIGVLSEDIPTAGPNQTVYIPHTKTILKRELVPKTVFITKVVDDSLNIENRPLLQVVCPNNASFISPTQEKTMNERGIGGQPSTTVIVTKKNKKAIPQTTPSITQIKTKENNKKNRETSNTVRITTDIPSKRTVQEKTSVQSISLHKATSQSKTDTKGSSTPTKTEFSKKTSIQSTQKTATSLGSSSINTSSVSSSTIPSITKTKATDVSASTRSMSTENIPEPNLVSANESTKKGKKITNKVSNSTKASSISNTTATTPISTTAPSSSTKVSYLSNTPGNKSKSNEKPTTTVKSSSITSSTGSSSMSSTTIPVSASVSKEKASNTIKDSQTGTASLTASSKSNTKNVSTKTKSSTSSK